MKDVLKYFAVAGVASLALSGAAYAEDVVVIGVPTGLSGANSTVAPAVVQSTELAVEEINASGGILGRQVRLEVADDESSASGAQRAFDDLISSRNANVIISMETSAARNAALPIVEKSKTPYIYTSLYEGHSCNQYLYANGPVVDQMVGPIIDHFMKNENASTFFLVGSDYAFGRGMLEFTRDYIESHGGEVVVEEYQPIDATDWTAIISAMNRNNPDAVIMATAGGAPNVTLQRQFKAAGIKALVGNLSVDELTAQSMGEDAEGIYFSASYLSTLDTPANTDFRARMEKKFGDKLYLPNDMSVPQYDAVYLYKAAVEKAGSLDDTDKIIEALAEVSFDGPRGRVQLSKQRHAPLDMLLGKVKADGSVDVVRRFENVDPGEQCPGF
ncbi:substrate-binding protein [Pikeienuella sp. HZG-20]|uniref:substrate-binding protein n=1 Tax=Paludibacillus litoralis TaxID=3133267 RepID=UPI0030EBD93F